jgi:hypothetical protein
MEDREQFLRSHGYTLDTRSPWFTLRAYSPTGRNLLAIRIDADTYSQALDQAVAWIKAN